VREWHVPGKSHLVSTCDVHLEDQIPVLVLHILEADVPKDSRVIDQDVDPPKGLDSSFDNGLSILNTVVVGNSFAATGLDFFDNGIGGL